MPSYISNVDADAYFVLRYPNDEWTASSEAEKTSTLATATRLIDQLNFSGCKTDEAQVNEFPRNTHVAVPVAIENACCEIAYALFSGHDIEYDANGLNIVKSKFGSVETIKDVELVPMYLIHNIPSSQAWHYIMPYLLNTQSLKLERLS